jgi:hypothetical protein
MTDRDHFAAAALTGMLAAPTDKDRAMDYWARLAYESADAMLRERERTDHDAAPAATAPTDASPLRSAQSVTAGMGTGNQTAPPCVETDGSSPAIAQPPASSDGSGEGRPLDVTRPDNGEAAGGRGHNTQEPVAWAVTLSSEGYVLDNIFLRKSEAEKALAWRNKKADYGARIVPLYREPQTCPYVVGRTTQHCSLTPFTLTDEERGAVSYYVGTGGPDGVDATLRALLERTK